MFGESGTYVKPDDVSKGLAVLGFYVSVIGLLSYMLKERLYMSDALIAIVVGIIVGPIGWNIVSPWDWTSYNDETRQRMTYELCRIVIGIQVLFTGISLPKAYLRHAWTSLATLLLLIMTIAWIISAAFIYALLPQLTYLEALCVAACVTPTDPVLANSVVKGRFAEKYIPSRVRNVIAAESAANDGLGFPFIYLSLYLLRRETDSRSLGKTIGWWVVDIWIYEILLSCCIGAVIGFLAMRAVKFAEQRKLIDHESFLAIGVGLTFLTLGLTGLLGSDDILACFIVGNAFTWNDYFRIRTEDESFQDVIDSLLNVGIFIYLGTLLPWSDFGNKAIGLDAWRLVVIAILLLLFKRLPWVLLTRRLIPELDHWREALFTGWFGPIGVAAIYYVEVGLENIPEERVALRQVIAPVVYFIMLSSVIVHGITIPIFKHSKTVYMRTKTLTSFKTGSSTFEFPSTFRRNNTVPNSAIPSARASRAPSIDGAPAEITEVSKSKTDNSAIRQDLETGLPDAAAADKGSARPTVSFGPGVALGNSKSSGPVSISDEYRENNEESSTRTFVNTARTNDGDTEAVV